MPVMTHTDNWQMQRIIESLHKITVKLEWAKIIITIILYSEQMDNSNTACASVCHSCFYATRGGFTTRQVVLMLWLICDVNTHIHTLMAQLLSQTGTMTAV